MTFAEQSEIWYRGLQTRRRRPARPTTLATYQSHLRKWILPNLGALEIAGWGNGGMKRFIDELSKHGLSPKAVHDIAAVVKQIVSSAIDTEGNELFPIKWNHDFIDMPVIEDQKQEPATKADIEKAGRDPAYGTLYMLLAATGLRIGEARALRYGVTPGCTSLDLPNKLISVRSQLYRSLEMPDPKTDAGVREADICADMVEHMEWYVKVTHCEPGGLVFHNTLGHPLHEQTVRATLKEIGVPPFHACRRFRKTHLEMCNVPPGLQDFWMGHATPGIQGVYLKFGDRREERRVWVEKVGLGFRLPRRKNDQMVESSNDSAAGTYKVRSDTGYNPPAISLVDEGTGNIVR